MAIDRHRAELAIAQFLQALGFEPGQHPELTHTPARVVEAFSTDLLAGYAVDIPLLLQQGSEAGTGGDVGIVAVREIAVATICPHHLMPALGTALVAYVPGSRILGIGTVASLVQAYARRLTLQEQIGQNVVAALLSHAGVRGAYCQLVFTHSCLSARGTHQTHARVVTVAKSGELALPEAVAALTLALQHTAEGQ